MSQIVHYFALLFIIFVLAEIRNVLIFQDPFQPTTISIWEESPETSNMGDLTLSKQ